MSDFDNPQGNGSSPSVNCPSKNNIIPRSREHVDIVIIGAGVSGINTAHYIKTSAPRGTSYVILDRRGHWGGTWDLFKYPGIRSDSDMFTFGFSWNPWNLDKPLGSGPEISAYLSESAAIVGAEKNTRFHHHVLSSHWSSTTSNWAVTAKTNADNYVEFSCRFMVLGTGYYNYDEPMHAPIPGLDKFAGPVVQPQFWPDNLDYMNKNILIIGSGATAVTLLPNLAEDAKHVTMLQRSPTYIATLPTSKGLFARIFQAILPRFITHPWNRILHISLGYMLYYYCLAYPAKAREALEKGSAKQLLPGTPIKPNHSPHYNPWEQRLCICPDGDFYAALRSGKASIVTDRIERITENTVVLVSGRKLQPDIIVAATGLQLQFAGGIKISVDGNVIDPSTKFTWKGCMIQDVPNFVFVIGYVNASWTLSAETTATLFMRLMRRMKAVGATVALPTLEKPETMPVIPLFNLSSTYFQSSAKLFPKGGVGQWAQKKNHIIDVWESSWGNLSNGLKLC